MTDDAIVAEIVGYTLYRKTWSDCADMIICWPPDVELFTKPEVVLAKDLGDYDFQNSTMRPPRFISAPTWASDGIVLEWVQGSKIFPQFTSRTHCIPRLPQRLLPRALCVGFEFSPIGVKYKTSYMPSRSFSWLPVFYRMPFHIT